MTNDKSKNADSDGVRGDPAHQSILLGAASCAPESRDLVVVHASEFMKSAAENYCKRKPKFTDQIADAENLMFEACCRDSHCAILYNKISTS